MDKKKEEYCNLEPAACKKSGKLYSDNNGYICATCGKRVSKWLPVANVINKLSKEEREKTKKWTK